MAGLGQHQVDRGIAVIDEVLSDLREVSLLDLDAGATGVSLVALARLEARVAELKHRVLAHGTEVAVEQTLVELAARHDAQHLRVLGEPDSG